tara:strand:- start:2131 stop:2469 length:339 start_codon:yes stop_codon:yes gene_type:complete
MLAFLIVSFSSVVTAAEKDSLNSFISEYPSHTCSLPPPKPDELSEFTGKREVEKEVVKYNNYVAEYNSKVDDYNEKTEIYRSCVKKYINNAKKDMEKINKKITEAIQEANSH